jgi:hypothetical protein
MSSVASPGFTTHGAKEDTPFMSSVLSSEVLPCRTKEDAVKRLAWKMKYGKIILRF